MTKKTAVILIVACSVISAVIGASCGAEYTMRQWETADSARAARETAAEKQRASAISARDAADQSLLSQLFDCRAQFSEGTILYETPANTQLSIGLRGVLGLPVNVTPGLNVVPRWWVPAKIKPQIYGPAQGAVYYYVGGDGKVDGPYLPTAPGGQR